MRLKIMNIIDERVTHRMDELGRIVIPKQIRARYNIKPGQELDFYSIEDEDNGVFICLKQPDKSREIYEKNIAKKVLKEYGIDIPDELY